MTNKYLVGAAGSSELTSMTAADLAQKIHARELSSEEVTPAHLGRIPTLTVTFMLSSMWVPTKPWPPPGRWTSN